MKLPMSFNMLSYSKRLIQLQLQPLKKFATSASSTFKEKKIRVLDLDINYIETLGSPQNAHPIFILPGTFGSIEMDVKPIIHEFNKEKYKCIAWDPPGYGGSRPPNRPFLPKGETVYEYDVKYATELMNVLGVERYTLLAWSGGALTGIMMANQTPEKVSGLITWGAFGFASGKMVPGVKMMRKLGLNAIPDSRRAPLTKMYGEELLLEMWNGWMNESLKMVESEVFKEGGTFQNLIKNVQCPALVIQGLKDALIDVSYAHHLNSTFNNSRLHLIENGTHNLHLRETKEFVNCIQTFIDTIVLSQK
ncbi:unnamed protein product [Orchesella dallaii]|uniref:AB hydrolase-1 domain-containing protein n=1 Tax=Orchesella dallaii TaxID=48710 RepID=A0ABP1PLU4_9HEXA